MSIRNATFKELIFNQFTISYLLLFLAGWGVHENTK